MTRPDLAVQRIASDDYKLPGIRRARPCGSRPFVPSCREGSPSPMTTRTCLFVIAWFIAAAVAPDASLAQSDSAAVHDTTAASSLIRPGDVIRLKVWREADWSGDFEVNEAG